MTLRYDHLALFFFSLALAQDEYPGKIDCYSFTGNVYHNNTQCPGSRTCCQTADLCDPNRFCLQNDQIIIPTCASFPWDNCANICKYDPGTGFLPRAVKCDYDGSYCCDNDPQCCPERRGIVLNGLGAVVSTDGGISASSSASSSASIATTTTTMSFEGNPTSASANPTTTGGLSEGSSGPSSSSDGLSTGAKAGIGLGVAVGAIAVIILAVLLVRARRHHSALQEQWQRSQQYSDPTAPLASSKGQQLSPMYSDHGSEPAELESRSTPVYEMPTQAGPS